MAKRARWVRHSTLSHPAAQQGAYETRALLSLAKSCFTLCAMARKTSGKPRERSPQLN